MTTDHEEQIGKLRLEIRDLESKLHDEFVQEIRLIRENHLAHIQASVATIDKQLTKNTTDTDWIKRFFWIVATTSIAGMLTGIMNLIIAV
jgi:hypothetical protein